MLVAVLRIVDREAHHTADLVGKGPQIIPGRTDPHDWLLYHRHLANIVILLYLSNGMAAGKSSALIRSVNPALTKPTDP
jgi:hypothetical protein